MTVSISPHQTQCISDWVFFILSQSHMELRTTCTTKAVERALSVFLERINDPETTLNDAFVLFAQRHIRKAGPLYFLMRNYTADPSTSYLRSAIRELPLSTATSSALHLTSPHVPELCQSLRLLFDMPRSTIGDVENASITLMQAFPDAAQNTDDHRKLLNVAIITLTGLLITGCQQMTEKAFLEVCDNIRSPSSSTESRQSLRESLIYLSHQGHTLKNISEPGLTLLVTGKGLGHPELPGEILEHMIMQLEADVFGSVTLDRQFQTSDPTSAAVTPSTPTHAESALPASPAPSSSLGKRKRGKRSAIKAAPGDAAHSVKSPPPLPTIAEPPSSPLEVSGSGEQEVMLTYPKNQTAPPIPLQHIPKFVKINSRFATLQPIAQTT